MQQGTQGECLAFVEGRVAEFVVAALFDVRNDVVDVVDDLIGSAPDIIANSRSMGSRPFADGHIAHSVVGQSHVDAQCLGHPEHIVAVQTFLGAEFRIDAVKGVFIPFGRLEHVLVEDFALGVDVQKTGAADQRECQRA